MPTGKVKWFDEERGFGFIHGDDGAEVFLHVSALPTGTSAPRAGTRLDYGIADGRRGPSALSAHIIEAPQPAARVHRKPPEDMVPIIEDLIKVLDSVSNTLRRGRHPDKKTAAQTAALLRAVAQDLDA
ncbi:MAG: cold shock domain-containing protein [Bifidobacteriaceae bacterium]|nr:cold shock domain-containing protein [Bifidobacteriaceae bacterium]